MPEKMDQEDEDFQIAPSHRGRGTNKVKRVYIGNLPKVTSSVEDLEVDLTAFLRSQLSDLEIVSIQINKGGNRPHALVDCGSQANILIRKIHQQSFQGQRLVVQRERRNEDKKNQHSSSASNKNQRKKATFGRGWSAPQNQTTKEYTAVSVEQLSVDIGTVVEDEIAQTRSSGDDLVNTALASTAAASLVAAMNAFAQGDESIAVEHKTDDLGIYDDEQKKADEPESFQLKPMSELLSDFGVQDLDWKKKHVEPTTEKKEPNESRLAPKGKAPIHVAFTSFGFSKGAPKRMDGWSHRQPLLPMDCRDYKEVPGYLAWQDGLSGAVKRSFQQQHYHRQDDEETLQDFARKVLPPRVWDALVEAQQEGGHGYASPLEMTIYVGSEAGRHRSVVACEWAATELRKRLRANENNALLHPVSVGTFHRDVEAHRQQQQNNKKSREGNSRKKGMEFAGDW